MVYYKRRLYKITKKGMFCHQIVLHVWIMPGLRQHYNSRFDYVTRLLRFRDIVRCVQSQLRKKISQINVDRISRSLPTIRPRSLPDQTRAGFLVRPQPKYSYLRIKKHLRRLKQLIKRYTSLPYQYAPYICVSDVKWSVRVTTIAVIFSIYSMLISANAERRILKGLSNQGRHLLKLSVVLYCLQ